MKQVLCGVLVLGWIPTLGVVAGARWIAGDALAAQGRTPVKVTRLYTGTDGKTKVEEFEIPVKPRDAGSDVAASVAVTSLQVRRTTPQYNLDWHPAPRRQLVVTLSGESEIELEGGRKIRLGPGHILLAEDTTGQGHISRAVASKDRIALDIALADGATLPRQCSVHEIAGAPRATRPNAQLFRGHYRLPIDAFRRRQLRDMTHSHLNEERVALNRRRFLECLSAMGLGSTLMPDALVIAAQDAEAVTVEMIEAAEKIARVSFTPEERQAIVARVNASGGYLAGFAFLRTASLGNSTPPAIVFNPVPPGKVLPSGPRFLNRREPVVTRPPADEALAFLPITHLAKLVQTRQVTPSELTELYLSRLTKYDPTLHCVVSLTPELARAQARQADAEIAAGKYRGPLHGLPFGLKDLFAVRGTKTTWGASPYKDQVIDADATVYTKLREAGAILVAKLSTGALALSAQWFGGLTRNPWNTEQDASGSSAGPGSATAAGLVAFAIGSDTGGSVIQPSARNGITGMRPTFGRVSRYGAMALAWTQDTVGPMCRSAEDCALVFDAIYGPDGKDNTVLDVPFGWDATADVAKLRVGYLRSAFSDNPTGLPNLSAAEQLATRRNNEAALRVIRGLGVEVVPFDLPKVAIEAIDFIRYAETAAAFDDLTRSGRLREVEHGPEQSRRPAEIRPARFIPAVEYIQANQYRLRVMEQVDAAMSGLDLFLGANLLLTNRTGHPVISLPSGFFEGSPTGLQLTGKLFGEPELLLLAHAFQSRTDHHLKHPPL